MTTNDLIDEKSKEPAPYSDEARELARNGIVGGKPLKDWLDAPVGKFAKTVRQAVDPYFGLLSDADAMPRKWQVRVRYSYTPEPVTEYASRTYEVEAITPEEAKELAEESFDDDGKLERGDDHEIDEVCDPRLME